ncbi:hypothetical protein KEM55_003938 [Ascosphaera atra]|nr:hypothetical protein KEM55_003938 [Ascosphaera atra]
MYSPEISLRHAAFRALKLSTPAYAAAPMPIRAAGLVRPFAAAAPAPVRWYSNESSGFNPSRAPAPAADGQGNGVFSARGRSMNSTRAPPTPCETVYIGNLFFDVTAEQLRGHCEQYGTVEDVRIIFDSRGLSKGFGYVRFDSVESAQRCIDNMHMTVYQGRRAAVNFAHFNAATGGGRKDPASSDVPTKTLFIGNLAWEMTDRDLNDLFKDVNNVVDVRVSIDRRTGRPRGFAHADFLDVESAEAARKLLEGRMFFGRQLKLDYTYGSKATNAMRSGSGVQEMQ